MMELAAHSVRWVRSAAIDLPAALGLAALALAVGVRVAVLSSGQFDYDEGVYWQSLHAMRAHRLFGSVYSSQPPAFLLLVTPVHRLLDGSLLADRLVVLALAAAGLVAVYQMWSAFDLPWTGLAAAAVLGADPLFFRQSVTLQADGPAIGLALAATAAAAVARTRLGPARVLLAVGAGVLLATAVFTKLLAAAALPSVVILLAFHRGSRRRAAGLVGAALLGGCLAAAAFVLPFAGSWPQMWDQSVGLHLRARTAPTGGLDAWTVLRELPLTAIAAVGAAIAVRRAPVLAAAGMAWAAAAVLLLAVHRPLWPHHLVVLTAPLAILAGTAAELAGDARRRWPAPLVALLLVVATMVSALYVRSLATPDATRLRAIAALRAATRHSELLITDDQYSAALARRATPPELVDTSQVRVLSGDLTLQQVEVAAERWHVRAVLLDITGTPSLSQIPGLREWLAERFPTVQEVGGGRLLFLR